MVKTFKPTYLYIKECNCGKKYFGKSTNFKNMKTYKGRGEYWTNHLEKHNCKIKTKIYSINRIKQVCMIKALHFSICNNIVKSKEWKNLKYENGLDGGETNKYWLGKHLPQKTREKLRNANLGKKHKLETRKKMSKSHTGKIKSKEHCENLSMSLKGNTIPQNVRDKISNTLKNKPEIWCDICKRGIQDIGNNVNRHFNSKLHKNKCINKQHNL